MAGQRLDVFVQSQLRRTSRTRTQAIIRASAYDSDGHRLRVNDRVRAHQHVLLWRPPWDETSVPREIPVLYEDDHILAVDKPANVPVHPTARYHHNTVIKLLQAERPGEFLALGHRIDRETSGILLLPKTPRCERLLKRQLEKRENVEKSYVALTWGVPASGASDRRFRVNLPLRLDPTNPFRVKMVAGTHPEALEAVTYFEVESVRCAGDRTYARVRCDLETGRQHQIRVHLAELGTPIVGDKLYGPDETCFGRGVEGTLTDEDREKLELDRHALHAFRLTLNHPVTGERLAIEAPLPADLRRFWEGLPGVERAGGHLPRWGIAERDGPTDP